MRVKNIFDDFEGDTFAIVTMNNVTSYGMECHSLPIGELIGMINSLSNYTDNTKYSGFNYPDYYSEFMGLPITRLRDILNAFYAEIVNSLPGKGGLRLFLSKGRKVEMYSDEYTLNTLLDSDIIISGCRISNETKISCMEFMQDNNIPAFPNCFRILIRRYMETGRFYLIPLKGDE